MIKPKRSLGQNFLKDQNILNKIIKRGNINENNILEIGPGTGNLTAKIIMKNPNNLILVEKDQNLISGLKNIIKFKNITIYNEDVLKINLEKIILKNTIVFGNLPYNISTQILLKLIKIKNKPLKYSKLILMFQKEVAEKIMAKCDTKNYGRLAVIANWKLKITDHFKISKNCFWPIPKVDSMLLVFEPISSNKYKIKNIKNLEYITQIFFSNKRKMVNKCFKKIFLNSNEVSKKLKIDLSSRPGEIKADKYYQITELFEKYKIS